MWRPAGHERHVSAELDPVAAWVTGVEKEIGARAVAPDAVLGAAPEPHQAIGERCHGRTVNQLIGQMVQPVGAVCDHREVVVALSSAEPGADVAAVDFVEVAESEPDGMP